MIWDKPHFINSEKIGFGYYGKLELKNIEIESSIPDSIQYTFTKEYEKDTLNFWLSRNSFDSLNFNLTDLNCFKSKTLFLFCMMYLYV